MGIIIDVGLAEFEEFEDWNNDPAIAVRFF